MSKMLVISLTKDTNILYRSEYYNNFAVGFIGSFKIITKILKIPKIGWYDFEIFVKFPNRKDIQNTYIGMGVSQGRKFTTDQIVSRARKNDTFCVCLSYRVKEILICIFLVGDLFIGIQYRGTMVDLPIHTARYICQNSVYFVDK